MSHVPMLWLLVVCALIIVALIGVGMRALDRLFARSTPARLVFVIAVVTVFFVLFSSDIGEAEAKITACPSYALPNLLLCLR